MICDSVLVVCVRVRYQSKWLSMQIDVTHGCTLIKGHLTFIFCISFIENVVFGFILAIEPRFYN